MQIRIILGCACVCLMAALPTAQAGSPNTDELTIQYTEDFLTRAFAGSPAEAKALWVDAALREQLIGKFGWHPGLRVRYWQRGARTAWILDEIGKEKPITAGIVIEDGLIAQVCVLIFRESRGGEIKYPFFTDQFSNAALSDSDDLTRQIDGITGATLSVQAMKRMARVALKLHKQTQIINLANSN